jgi:hypothetical protein
MTTVPFFFASFRSHSFITFANAPPGVGQLGSIAMGLPCHVDIVLLVSAMSESKDHFPVCKCGGMDLKKVVMERKEEQKKKVRVRDFQKQLARVFFSPCKKPL